jgi:hypothetical protein
MNVSLEFSVYLLFAREIHASARPSSHPWPGEMSEFACEHTIWCETQSKKTPINPFNLAFMSKTGTGAMRSLSKSKGSLFVAAYKLA